MAPTGYLVLPLGVTNCTRDTASTAMRAKKSASAPIILDDIDVLAELISASEQNGWSLVNQVLLLLLLLLQIDLASPTLNTFAQLSNTDRQVIADELASLLLGQIEATDD